MKTIRTDIEEVVAANRAGDVHRLTAATLRYCHSSLKKDESFGLVTVHQRGLSRAERIARNESLLHQLRSAQLGFTKLRAVWEDGGAYVFFVCGITTRQLVSVMKRWGQDVAVFGSGDGQISRVKQTGEAESLGEFDPRAIATVFRTMLGQPLRFELLPGSFVQALMLHRMLEPIDLPYPLLDA